jgi:hypothetical protein
MSLVGLDRCATKKRAETLEAKTIKKQKGILTQVRMKKIVA